MTADSGISDSAHPDGGDTDTVHSGTGDPFQVSVFHLLRLILQEHQSLWAARLASAGLPECTKPQYALLRSAMTYPGLDQAAAGAFTGTDKSTVVSLVDRLERRGLLRRADDPGDRRRRRLFLTDAGEDFVRAAIPVVDQLTDDLLARLSDAERETLVPILLKLTGEAAVPAVPGVLAASRSELRPDRLTSGWCGRFTVA